MSNNLVIIGLVLNLIASFLIAYGRIFRSKETIKKESNTEGGHNTEEERHRLKETRIAQIGAGLMVVGFAVQIIGNVFQ
ncbi:MAG: hypothetical protein M3224_00970 [Thermoproteota archaeon]|nr:hypothetical protein [Thermoproteota archaeon]